MANYKHIKNHVPVVSSSAPASPQQGDLWYDSSANQLKVYDTTDNAFVKVHQVTPTLSSIAGNIITTTATNLTLTGTGFLSANLIVSFTPSGGSATTATVNPTNDTTATVAVPSAIYGQSASTVIAVKVTNSDNKSSGTVNSTVVALPSGGTITSSGGYRIHSFTSSGTFVNTVSNLSIEYLVIGGGGGSGRQHGGGGGAGGYRNSTGSESSGRLSTTESTLTLSTGNKTVTVGAGGAGSTSAQLPGSDGVSSVFDSITSLGGGGGGSYHASSNSNATGRTGGSGGGSGSIEG